MINCHQSITRCMLTVEHFCCDIASLWVIKAFLKVLHVPTYLGARTGC